MAGVGKPKSADMHPGPGFRIRYEIERPPPEVVAGFGAFEIPDISDLMNRLYTLREFASRSQLFEPVWWPRETWGSIRACPPAGSSCWSRPKGGPT